MQINKSINKRNLNELVIKSSVWNSIIEVFKDTKKLDITPYLVSIQLKWNTILVKTLKPIINTELLILNDKIIKKVEEKFKKIWIRFEDFEIRYF